MTTAQWYFMEGIKNKGHQWFLYENVNKSGAEISAASWIKQINRFVYYLKQKEVGVFSMDKRSFEPNLDTLKPFFGPESGIDTDEKAYAFILGIVYGKLLQVQGARGVNTGANALSWLKRLTLRGTDLPELYVKVREKLLAYESEKSPEIRAVLGELGRLGIVLGDAIQLDEIKTNYYLLLGQSMTESVLPTKDQNKVDKTGGK
jgi:CRISPR-associated protein Csh1